MLLLENVLRLSKPNIMASVTTALFHLPCGGLELGKYFDRGCVKRRACLLVCLWDSLSRGNSQKMCFSRLSASHKQLPFMSVYQLKSLSHCQFSLPAQSFSAWPCGRSDIYSIPQWQRNCDLFLWTVSHSPSSVWSYFQAIAFTFNLNTCCPILRSLDVAECWFSS